MNLINISLIGIHIIQKIIVNRYINFFIILDSNKNSITTTIDIEKHYTCHSCKLKCLDIWRLLEHVYFGHGFRISDEALPNFDYPIKNGSTKINNNNSSSSPSLTTTKLNNNKQQQFNNKIVVVKNNNDNETTYKQQMLLSDETTKTTTTMLIDPNNTTTVGAAARVLLEQQNRSFGSLLNSLISSPTQQQNNSNCSVSNALMSGLAARNRINCRYF